MHHYPRHMRGSLANTEQQAHAPPREALRLHLPRVQQVLREQERLEAPREQPALAAGDVEVRRAGRRGRDLPQSEPGARRVRVASVERPRDQGRRGEGGEDGGV